MQTAVIQGGTRKGFFGISYVLMAFLTLSACSTVKPIDNAVVSGLAGTKMQVVNLYAQFTQNPIPTQGIDDLRSQFAIIKSKADAREGKDSKFSDMVAAIQETFERHVAARQKAPWKQVDVEDYGKSITNMIQDTLDIENKRSNN